MYLCVQVRQSEYSIRRRSMSTAAMDLPWTLATTSEMKVTKYSFLVPVLRRVLRT